MTVTESIPEAHMRRSPYSPGVDPAKLQELRFAMLLSQEQLAARAGLSRAWIAKLECGRGRPSVDTLRKLCTALDCSPVALLPDPMVRKLARSLGVSTSKIRRLDFAELNLEEGPDEEESSG